MRFRDLADKRVAILGLGREGQAVWRQIRRHFPDMSLSLFAESAADDGFIERLDSALDHCQIGPLDVAELQHFDVLVRSAGISPYRPEMKALRSLGVQFTTATNLWFAGNPQAKTICITGTKGKSTTAALVAHLLSSAGLRVNLAGNIGRPMLDFEPSAVDWWVIELSSYQISDLEAEPDIAVILNLSDEHIDWHGDAEHYRADKLKLSRLVKVGGLQANYSDTALRESLRGFGRVIWFNRDGGEGWQSGKTAVVCTQDKLAIPAPKSLPGEHNMQNLAAALTVIDALDLEIPGIDQVLTEFTGLPHRLQWIGEKNGICYIDDSISTTPVSVTAALNTVGSKGVVLLLGGLDRGLDWTAFSDGLLAHPPLAIVTMPDNGSEILASLRSSGVEPEAGLHAVDNLAQAVKLAQGLIVGQGCILLSPGAPSFPYFRDFEDRGEQFASYAGIEKKPAGTH